MYRSTTSPIGRDATGHYRVAVDVKAVQHVALTVDDLDAALRFYSLLGFDPLPRPDIGIAGAWLRAATRRSTCSSCPTPRRTRSTTSHCG